MAKAGSAPNGLIAVPSRLGSGWDAIRPIGTNSGMASRGWRPGSFGYEDSASGRSVDTRTSGRHGTRPSSNVRSPDSPLWQPSQSTATQSTRQTVRSTCLPGNARTKGIKNLPWACVGIVRSLEAVRNSHQYNSQKATTGAEQPGPAKNLPAGPSFVDGKEPLRHRVLQNYRVDGATLARAGPDWSRQRRQTGKASMGSAESQEALQRMMNSLSC
jgi:hypothetical protein